MKLIQNFQCVAFFSHSFFFDGGEGERRGLDERKAKSSIIQTAASHYLT